MAPRHSPSVAALQRGLGAAPVTAAAVVHALLEQHRDYAPDHPRPVALDVTRGDLAEAEEWTARAASAYVLAPDDVLHGRTLIVGLSLVDLDLGGQLLSLQLLPRILDELQDAPPLAVEGQRRWAILLGERPYPAVRTPADTDDTVPPTPPDDERVTTHTDDPAKIDQLGRRPFATVVGDRIRDVWATQSGLDGPGSFMVHLHGPWGSGKSSLLNFLAHDLREHPRPHGEGEPLIVQFDAWRHQRLRPPWWALIREIHEQSVRGLARTDRRAALRLRLRWRLWRAQLDWLPVLVALLLLVVGVPLAWFGARAIGTAEASAELPLKLLAALLTLGAAAFALSRSLVFGSARAAAAYADLRTDPLDPVVKLFARLVGATGRRLVVFIDDLDRCDAEHVVELLEGIQTLFRTVPVTYVVAADRKWICSSFEARYGGFGKTIGEPGRPLGYLFLDKLFQVSAPVPQPLPALQQRYWESLLSRNDGSSTDDALRAEAKEARHALGGAHTQDELERRIKAAAPEAEYAMRAEAARRITSPQAQRATQHRLRAFAPLLESNPRAMKRLVNAYGLHQATHLLEGRSVQTDTLARWTIVEMRWPLLADHLAARPQTAAHIATPATAPRAVRALLADEHVRRVLLGGTAGDPPGTLGEREIRAIVGSDVVA